ncbi:MAG: S8 family serine peptidase [Actinomycetota bacterium]
MRRALPALALLTLLAPVSAARSQEAVPGPDPVVVATFDTGTNPFHPCFQRDWTDIESPREFIPTYPADAIPVELTFADTYQESLAESQDALQSIVPRRLHYVPGTNLSFYGTAWSEFVDNYPHGAQASSQIACEQYGLAPNAHLVIVNWYDNNAAGPEMIRWAASQPWIDVVHLNIQDTPLPVRAREIDEVIASGKVVVIAAGNGVQGLGPSYPMELSRWNGPPGSLIAGANDNGGYAVYSNLSPHVVMDGCGTVAASPNSYGDAGFSGTSSASPRITGYVARLIGELRAEFGHTGEGLVTIPEGSPRPATGPLADGVLTAPEIHDAVRATANPNPHSSTYDGTGGAGSCIYWVPQPTDTPIAVYAKMGYGEVSEHTFPAALSVLAGRAARPARSEDNFYAVSEKVRQTLFPPD